MNTFEESVNDQDPDYVSAVSNSQQKIYEENGKLIDIILFNNNFLWINEHKSIKGQFLKNFKEGRSGKKLYIG